VIAFVIGGARSGKGVEGKTIICVRFLFFQLLTSGLHGGVASRWVASIAASASVSASTPSALKRPLSLLLIRGSLD
jgi:hypothetical protein